MFLSLVCLMVHQLLAVGFTKATASFGSRIARSKASRIIHSALADIHAGDRVALIVDRGPGIDNRELRLTLTVGEGL